MKIQITIIIVNRIYITIKNVCIKILSFYNKIKIYIKKYALNDWMEFQVNIDK